MNNVLKRNFSQIAFFAVFTIIVSLGHLAYAQSGAIQAGLSKLPKAERGIAEYYKATSYRPIWVGNKNKSRRTALIAALKNSDLHGLPKSSYQVDALSKALRNARTDAHKASAEVSASRIFVRYAQNLTSGVLRPSSVDREIAIFPKKIAAVSLLQGVAKGSGKAYLKALEPKHPDYVALLREMQRVRRSSGGDGVQIPSATLRPGVKSNAIVAMRQKLRTRGFGNLGKSNIYDADLVAVVKAFQKKNGLSADGVAGPATIAALNGVSSTAKRQHLIVNLERQRWLNFPRGKRHIYVNLPDFSVSVYDNGRQSFYSRTVIGKRSKDTRSPEFVDQMTHMVINPTWHVPSSIAGKEYLPIIKKDPGFLQRKNMTMLNSSGQAVNPANVDLAAFTEDDFPYNIKQRPNPGNALGRVKFMFPNKYNIYLHDTPAKSLFNRDIRAFSHGCIRVHKPFDFAYKLLERQTGNPEGFFAGMLNTGKEKYVNLKEPVPVIIGYQTVIFDGKGTVKYRADIYGRDAKIVRALKNAGVAI